MALRLNQATIVVRDYELNKRFFMKLGLRLIVDDPPHYARFEVPGNSATFSLECLDGATLPERGQTALYFELPSRQELDDYCRELEAKGFKFKEKAADRDKDWLWREAHLETPENHDVRLYYAGVNRLYPPWKVNADDLKPKAS